MPEGVKVEIKPAKGRPSGSPCLSFLRKQESRRSKISIDNRVCVCVILASESRRKDPYEVPSL